VDPRQWHVVEDQGPVGSCQGVAMSSVLEHCYFIDTAGENVSLSKMAAYRFSQEEDGIKGDTGSTLSGGAAAAKKGVCEERFFPYAEEYQRKIPSIARSNRSKFRIEVAQKLSGPDYSEQVRRWIGSGKGSVVIGVKWTKSMDQDRISKYVYRGSGGGHAVAITGYTKDELVICQSWGDRIFDGGYQYITDNALNECLGYGWNLAMAYSDLKDIEVMREYPSFNKIGDMFS